MAYMERINVVDPLYGEAIAVKIAMEQALRLGWSHVCFESDSLVLCNAINEPSSAPPWNIAEIVIFIRDQLKQNKSWQVRWIPRTANRMAHFLAKWAFSTEFLGSIPVDKIPACISLCDL